MGADTGQYVDATRALGAPIENVFRVLFCPLHSGALRAQQELATICLGIGEALDGRVRATHAPRVETDKVKTFGQPSVRERHRHRRGGEQPGAAGSAGVYHQRADGPASRGHSRDGEAGCAAARIPIIEWHFQASTLNSRRPGKDGTLDRGVGITLAGLPGDLLRVEPIQAG